MFLSTSQNNLLLRPGNLACTCKRPPVGTRDQPGLAWVCWDTSGSVGCGWSPLPGCPGGRCLGYGVASVRSGEQDLPSRGHGSSRKGPSLGSPPGSPCRERGQGRRCAPPHALRVPEPDPTSWGAESSWSRNTNLSTLTKPQVFESKTHAHPWMLSGSTRSVSRTRRGARESAGASTGAPHEGHGLCPRAQPQ